MIEPSLAHSQTHIERQDMPSFASNPEERNTFWSALARSPGIGVSIVDLQGNLLFVNDTSLEIFSGQRDIDYHGKKIGDFHSVEFTTERLKMISRVITSGKATVMRHVYLGRKIVSTLWPIRDSKPPFNRVIVVTRYGNDADNAAEVDDLPVFDSDYAELGELNVLTKRELEVFVMFGHGLNIPAISKILDRSPKTLERHKTSIAKKLGLKSQTDMVRIVSLLGLTYEDTKRIRLENEPASKVPVSIDEMLRADSKTNVEAKDPTRQQSWQC